MTKQLSILLAALTLSAGAYAAPAFDESTQFGGHMGVDSIQPSGGELAERDYLPAWDRSTQYGDPMFAEDAQPADFSGRTAIGDDQGSILDSSEFRL